MDGCLYRWWTTLIPAGQEEELMSDTSCFSVGSPQNLGWPPTPFAHLKPPHLHLKSCAGLCEGLEFFFLLLYCTIGILSHPHQIIHNVTTAGFWDPVERDIFPVGGHQEDIREARWWVQAPCWSWVSPSVEARREQLRKRQHLSPGFSCTGGRSWWNLVCYCREIRETIRFL